MASPVLFAGLANLGLSLFLLALAWLVARRSPDRAARGPLALFLGLVGLNYLFQAASNMAALAGMQGLQVGLLRAALVAALADPSALLWFALRVTRHPVGRGRALLLAAPAGLVLGLFLASDPAVAFTSSWEHRFAHAVHLAGFYALAWALLVQRYLGERGVLHRDRLGILVAAFGVVVLPRLLLVSVDVQSRAALDDNTLQPLLGVVALGVLLALPRLAPAHARAHATQTARGLAAMLVLVVMAWVLLMVPALHPAGFALVYSVRWYIVAAVLAAGMRRFELLGLPQDSERRVRAALMASVAGLGFAGVASALATLPGMDEATALAGGGVALGAAGAFVAAAHYALPSPPSELAWRRHALYRAHVELASPRAELEAMRHRLGLTVREAREVEALVEAERAAPAPPPPEALAEGAVVLGRYHLERLLGTGAFGRVFAAWDGVASERIVVKELRAEWRADPGALEAFRREAGLALRTRHPNLVGFRGLERLGDAELLVLEHVEGPTLRARLQGGRLPEAEAAALARDLLAGLGALHAAGIVHRDVKPENVVLRPDGRAVLLDFGAAQGDPDAGTRPARGRRAHPGTPAYMAPEQAAGSPLDARADLYAVGVVLWEALAGAPPGRGRVPPAWQAWLARALAREPAERWPDAAAMAAAMPVHGPRAARRAARNPGVAP